MHKTIASLHHPLVKHLVKLRNKKEYRSACKSALLSGLTLIEELCAKHRFKTVCLEEGYAPAFSFEADVVYRVTSAILKKITGVVHPEPIAAEITLPEEAQLTEVNYLLILDGVSDPGNMGTLLRTALALGWQGALITPGSTDPFNEKALRAAKGATFKIPLKRGSWQEVDALLKTERWMLLAAMPGKTPMRELQVAPAVALALGNEAQGLSERIRVRARAISIPMHAEMSSLNVACAGAILMQYIAEQNL